MGPNNFPFSFFLSSTGRLQNLQVQLRCKTYSLPADQKKSFCRTYILPEDQQKVSAGPTAYLKTRKKSFCRAYSNLQASKKNPCRESIAYRFFRPRFFFEGGCRSTDPRRRNGVGGRSQSCNFMYPAANSFFPRFLNEFQRVIISSSSRRMKIS